MSHEIELEEEFARASLNRRTLRRLLSFYGPHKKPLLWTLFLELLWVVSMLIDPRLIRTAVDGPLARRDLGGVLVVCGLMGLNVIVRAVLTRVELRTTTRIGVMVQDAIRRAVFSHIQRLSMRYFDRNRQGRIIARADRDVETLEHLTMWGPIILVSLVFSLVLGLAMLALSNGRLALWVLLAMPAVWAVSRLFHRIGMPAYRRVREAQAAIASRVAETITGVRVVQAFSAEAREQTDLERRQECYRGAVLSGARIAGAYIPSLSLIFHGLLLVILVVGGQQVVAGSLSVGALLEFVLLLGFVLGPVEGLGNLYNESMVAGAAAERIFLLLDTEPEVRDDASARDPGRLRGRIEFDRVCFSYDPQGRDGRQLESISFVIEANTTVALVGHTGAGKTSVTNLIARFYDAQEGYVRIDGKEIRSIPLAALHAQTGMVLQENFLFAGSVLDNLRFVHPGLTDEQARAGFLELGCLEVLEGFSEGLATEVGERGANLSEGERQIVCFVRALLAEPSILILDEATSAVDTRTEALILRALRRLSRHQTTVIIAHRLSTIRGADRIFVMQQARLVEQGTHPELIEKGGVYTALYSEYAS